MRSGQVKSGRVRCVDRVVRSGEVRCFKRVVMLAAKCAQRCFIFILFLFHQSGGRKKHKAERHIKKIHIFLHSITRSPYRCRC